MAAGNGGEWRPFEAALRSSLRLLRDSLGQRRGGLPGRDDCVEAEQQPSPPSALEALPINVKLYILSFLTPKDLCHLGSTSRYWQLTVEDPLLWRYFLIRDLPSWHSIDWKSLPDADIFDRSFSALQESVPADYMAAYKKCFSCQKRPLKSSQSTYRTMTSLLHSLVTQTEPRFAMFGPGLEDLDKSLVHKMMTSPDIFPLAGLPQRQIHGIGSGVTFRYKNQQTLNILTLYSKTSKERRTARQELTNNFNKMFHEINNADGTTQYNPIEHVKNVCQLVDGFIYIADAEAQKRHSRQIEVARMAAMFNPAFGPPRRPVLILSCISSVGIERIPCVYMAHQLQLNLLGQPWMVQDTEAETLTGLLDGIEWLLGVTRYNNTQ
ncbi:F-box only protein 4 isoform X1 [Eublepharis macularius]|uniref:F-box only protein 4 isoform X1 n=1 Tax=Eublepharis macularius TaxID=481883 RepID=A0AA97JRI7_EUBMA|nr:F-box only protein 4 isoform X1 [Eublepharis macularius]